MAHSLEEALTLAERIGYPVIVRPSFVIGGLAIDFCYSPEDLVRQLAAATVVDPDRPVRIDRYLEGIEVDIDAVSRRRAGADPGPPRARRAGRRPQRRLGRDVPAADGRARATSDLIVSTMERICLALGARGLVNAQFIVRDDGVYLIEVNPRASRTVPFMTKVTGVPMVELAVRIALGETLADLGWPNGLLEPPPFVAVKAPAFSTAKLRGVDPSVGPGMQSTGEVIGIGDDPRVALAKALVGRRARAAAVRRRRDRSRSRSSASPTATRAGCRASPGPSGRPATGSPRRRARGSLLREAGFGVTPGREARRRAGRRDRRGRDPRRDRRRRGPPRRQHPDATLRRRSATRRRSGSPRPPRGSSA